MKDCAPLTAENYPFAGERCADGLDNDCDDEVDEGCAPGCTPSCNDKACGSDGCGGSCGECSPNLACTEDIVPDWAGGPTTCIPRTAQPLGEYDGLGRVFMPDSYLFVGFDVTATVDVPPEVDAERLRLWIVSGVLTSASAKAPACDPEQDTGVGIGYGLSSQFDSEVIAAAAGTATDPPAATAVVPSHGSSDPLALRPLRFIVVSEDPQATGQPVTVQVEQVAPEEHPWAPYVQTFTLQGTLGGTITTPITFRRGDALFVGARRAALAEENDPGQPVELLVLTSHKRECSDSNPGDTCSGCGFVFRRAYNSAADGLGSLVRVLPVHDSDEESACLGRWPGTRREGPEAGACRSSRRAQRADEATTAGWWPSGGASRGERRAPAFGLRASLRASVLGDMSHEEGGVALVGALADGPTAPVDLWLYHSRRLVPSGPEEQELLAENGELQGAWAAEECGFLGTSLLCADADHDGLPWELELQLGTCDSHWGPGTDIGEAHLHCQEYADRADELVPSFEADSALASCAGIAPGTIACASVPPSCRELAPACWSAVDSDNDGLDDLAEIYGVITASPLNPQAPTYAGPWSNRLYDAGAPIRRGLYAPPTKTSPIPAENLVHDWRLDLSRIAPVSPTRYDVLLEVQAVLEEGDDAEALTAGEMAGVAHIYEAEGLECPHEAVSCSMDPTAPCCAGQELYGVRLHVFEKAPRVVSSLDHLANEDAVRSLAGLAVSPSSMVSLFNSGGLDEEANALGLEHEGTTPERRFTGVFRYASWFPGYASPATFQGQAYGVPGRAFWFKPSAFGPATSDRFAHELGHTLGLVHVGGAHVYTDDADLLANGARNPVYPSLMGSTLLPEKGCEGPACPACSELYSRFSRGLSPSVWEVALPEVVPVDGATSDGEAHRSWLSFLGCMVSGPDIVGCMDAASCPGAGCGCDPSVDSCQLDWDGCDPFGTAPECVLEEVCPAFDPATATTAASLDPLMSYKEPGSSTHAAHDDNDWHRMIAMGKLGLHTVYYPDRRIVHLPFNYPADSELGMSGMEAVVDISGYRTLPRASHLSFADFGLHLNRCDLDGPDPCSAMVGGASSCVPITCASVGCKSGAPCEPMSGRCECARDSDCRSGYCDFDGLCHEDGGICSCSGSGPSGKCVSNSGSGPPYPYSWCDPPVTEGTNAGVQLCSGSQGVSGEPTSTLQTPGFRLRAARFQVPVNPSITAASTIVIDDAPPGDLTDVEPPFLVSFAINPDRWDPAEASTDKEILRTSSLEVLLRPVPVDGAHDTYVFVVRHLYGSGGWEELELPAVVAGVPVASVRAFRWYRLSLLVSQEVWGGTELGLALRLDEMDWSTAPPVESADWTQIDCASVALDTFTPLQKQAYIGGSSVGSCLLPPCGAGPESHLSGRLDDLQIHVDNRIRPSQVCFGDGGPSQPHVGPVTAAPPGVCDARLNRALWGTNPDCGAGEACFREQCLQTCTLPGRPAPIVQGARACPSGTTCAAVAELEENRDEDVERWLSVCLPAQESP